MNKRNLPSRSAKDHLTPDLIGRYLFGKLPDRTRYRVERHLLECDFCSDALEGYSGQNNTLRITRNVEELRARLDNRVKRSRFVLPFGMQPYAVAASIALLITCTLVVWISFFYWGKQTTPSRAVQTTPEVDRSSQVTATDQQAKASVRTDTTLLSRSDKPLSQSPRPVAKKDGVKVKKNISQPEQLIADEPADNNSEEADNTNKEAIIAANKMAPPMEPVAEQPLPVPAQERVASTLPDANPANRSNSARAREQTHPATAKGITRVIKGKVTSAEDGTPLPGVNVLVKGTDLAALTDTYGNFTLEVPHDAQVLVFNFIGMLPEEKDVSSTNFVRTQLKPDIQALSEVVVIGYGTDNEKSATPAEVAKPAGGITEFNRYVKENLRHPENTQREVTVKVECVVQADGRLSDFVIRKSAGEVYDREAIRVLKEGPRWQPARQQGKPIPKKVTLRIPFKP